MIIAGYPGVGKSLYVKNNPNKGAFDLESSNFRDCNNQRPSRWADLYANIAVDLASQGALIFTPTHPEVIYRIAELLDKLDTDDERFKFFGIAPSIKLKKEWIEKLLDRHLATNLDKDLRAYERARDYFERDIDNFKKSIYVYTIEEMPKDKFEYIANIDNFINKTKNKIFKYIVGENLK